MLISQLTFIEQLVNILLTVIKMIEYVNLFLLLAIFGLTCYVYYKVKKVFCLRSILMDSEILDQLTNLENNVNSEVTKPKRGRKKKADTKINEVEENDVRDKRERLVACALSGNSKQYLGKEYTEQQINEMDSYNIDIFSNRYESVLSAQMTKSFGKSVINLYSNVACSVLGIGNQQMVVTHILLFPALSVFLSKALYTKTNCGSMKACQLSSVWKILEKEFFYSLSTLILQ